MADTNQDPSSVKSQVTLLYRKALSQGASIDVLDKMVAKYAQRDQVAREQEKVEDVKYQQLLSKKTPLLVRVFATTLPLLFLGLGIFLISNAVVPIAGYYLTQSQELYANDLHTPIPPEDVVENLSSNLIAHNVKEAPTVLAATTQETKPIILDQALDYTNLANWFNDTLEFGETQESSSYFIDIPKIDIYQAEVLTGGTRLDKSLIQYPGTANPGEVGAPVIFGHSVLRQFYNPDKQNSRRYNSIFSYIMTLEAGDKIYVTKDNIKYTYQVANKKEVKPEDTYILMQRRDNRLLKLVTCVPEGTYLRRGVLTAVLVNE